MGINILSSEIYNKISAGEVVERPASAIKELIENSIDGGATKISIEIFDGGIKKIIVKDNGEGIEPNDIEKAVMPHATSKISNADDLATIMSLGFRGEALASIAAVSKFQIVSKTDNNDTGISLTVHGGKILEKKEIGFDKGTMVTVSDLFYNTPARLKFLKKPKSEENEVTQMVAKMILANPNLQIRYMVDDQIIYNTFGNGLAEALYIIYGKETYDNLLEVEYQSDDITVYGFIARPTYCKPNRTYQTIFINGRVITNYMISSAVQDALEGYIMKGKFPLFALNLTIPYGAVDVNVHPSKQEVKFENSGKIYGIVNTAIFKTVSSSNYIQTNIMDTPVKEEVDTTRLTKIEENKGFSFADLIKKSNNTNIEFKNSESVLGQIIVEKSLEPIKQNILEEVEIYSEPIVEQTKKYEQNEIKEVFSNFKTIGIAFDTYIFIEKEENLLVVDQHAAHERQLYDKIMTEIKSNSVVKQDLLAPYTFDVNNKEKDFLLENIEVLESFGIDICQFGENTFKVSAVPYVLSEINLKQFFELILEDISSMLKKPLSFINDKFTKMACRAAVKAGNKLSEGEIKILIQNFVGNKNVLLCPHGRPVVVEIKKTEIEKWFRRIV